MEANRVNALMLQFKDVVPREKIGVLKTSLRNADDDSYEAVNAVKIRNSKAVLLVSIFLGMFGIDRFIIGDVGFGIAKLLFGWMTCGIWPIIDIFFSYKAAKQKNMTDILYAIYVCNL